jgi:hypothetical protein
MYRLERVAGGGIIAPRRSSSAIFIGRGGRGAPLRSNCRELSVTPGH